MRVRADESKRTKVKRINAKLTSSMGASLYFYDLETSGFNPRSARIMQFAGQRTDMALKPIGEADNILVRLTDDVLPEPDAVLVHGITPQQTRADGLSEAEFLKYLSDNVFKPDTIIVGYNNIRFDDEFIRYTLWRNFYDAYEWAWKDGRSRWDLLDAVRMTRALRPDGIKWPFAPDGKPSVRLELLSSINGLDHKSAHDALSDVQAAIAVARLLSGKQPKLFDYLLNLRDKNKVAVLVEKGQPFVYTSGRYPSEYEKTTLAVMVAPHPHRQGCALVYDLRVNPEQYVKMSPAQLAEAWQQWGKEAPYFPVKMLAYNKAPAIAPLSVLDKDSLGRIKLDKQVAADNLKRLHAAGDFADKLAAAADLMQPKRPARLMADEMEVDGALYDGFISDDDKTKMSVLRAADEAALSGLQLDFTDERLKLLLPLYKARNYPKSLSGDEMEWWEKFKAKRLLEGGSSSPAGRYFRRIEELMGSKTVSAQQQYLLEELNLYGQSVIPEF